MKTEIGWGDIGAVIGLLITFFHFAMKMGEIKSQVSENRAGLERVMNIVLGQMRFVALEAGKGEFHSPFRLREEAKAPFRQFEDELHGMYRSTNKPPDDGHFMLMIQEKLGERLEKIWSERQFDPGHCLLACLEIAKEPS